jgi:solute carrier family 25 2-oxodicarboxylate transporter 21
MPRKATAMDTLPPITGGAVVTSIVMYPVDVVRAICMSNPGVGAGEALSGFIKTHGYAGFLKQGLVAEVTRASFSRMIKFWMQPIAHQNLFGRPENKGSPITKGLAGAIATVPEVLIISPLENMKLAEQLDKEKRFKGPATVASHLVKTRGVLGGLYIGYAGMQIRQVLWTGTFFMSLDLWKSGVKSVGISNQLAQDVVSGFCAGASGVAMNCWTDVARSVLQKEAIAETFKPDGLRPSAINHFLPFTFFGKAAQIAGEKGFMGGLYAGVGPKMIHLGGSGAILAVLMPRFKAAYFKMMDLE